MGYGLTEVTPPVCEPLSMADARTHQRVTQVDQDPWISDAITAARQWCEQYTGRRFIQATLKLTLDGFVPVIRLPRPELRSVTSIVYDDANGDAQTLSTSMYQVDASRIVGRIMPAVGQTWPSTYSGALGTVRVTYVAGYADDGSSPVTNASRRAGVPGPIKQAMKLLISEMYERREAGIAGVVVTEVPIGVGPLLAPYTLLSMD